MRVRSSCVSWSAALGLAVVAGCAAGSDPVSELGGSGPPGATGSGGGAGGENTGGASGLGGGVAVCGAALPAESYGAGVDAAAAAVFAAPPSGTAPFVFDPPSGVVLPIGWPSPELLVHTASLPALARLEIEAGGMTAAFTAVPAVAPRAHGDSVVEGSWWTVALPDALWDEVRCAAAHGAIEWRVRHAADGASAAAPAAAGTLRLLEDSFEPDMTYLQIRQPDEITQPDDFVVERLAVASGIPQDLVETGNECIGCHTSSPDGKDVVYQHSGSAGWQLAVVRPVADGPAVPSPALGSSAAALLETTSLMVPTTSAGAWSDATGRWVGAVTSAPYDPGGKPSGPQLALIQIDAPAAALHLGPPTAPGATPATPALAPDATRIVYVSTDGMVDGYFGPTGWGSTADLWQIPITLTKNGPPVFGAPSPVDFASGSPDNETYPAFSDDGALLTFTRTAPGKGGYDEETAEIYVMPADGSAPPTRLAANDAPADASVYAGLGTTSSWSRFGESSIETPEGRYYFVLFSSRRGSGQLWENRATGSNYVPGRPIARLYLATVRVEPDGSIATFPAALVPGQRVDSGAHTASLATVTSVPPPDPN